jgi:Methyltransferase domain
MTTRYFNGAAHPGERLSKNLPAIFERTATLDRVLDVGGLVQPLNTATHILDVLPYEARGHPLDEKIPVRYSEKTYVQHDICKKPWPYRDKFFDFSFCTHTLEDVRDPVGACEELMRVSRAGYIEVPSRLRESFHSRHGYWWRRLLGRPILIGMGEHRWLCEREGQGLVFTAKTATGTHSRKYFIVRAEVGRDLTPEEANIGLFWNDYFPVREKILVRPGETEADYRRFKREALEMLSK